MADENNVLNFQDAEPSTDEVAASVAGRDITKPYITPLDIEPNADYILTEEGLDLDKYFEILTDDQVYATFQQRRQAVTSREWDVMAGDEEDPKAQEAADLLRKHLSEIDWDQTTDKMLYATFFGFSIAELMWEMVDGYWRVRPQVRNIRRFEFGPEDTLLLKTVSKPHGEEMPREKFWVHRVGASDDDNPHGRGLAHYLYWPTYFKRQGLKFWLIFLDKFAQPTMHAKGPPAKVADEQWRNELLKILRRVQTDTALVTSDEATVELLEAKRGGQVEYDAIQGRMNSAISKVILSQTMTTDAQGGNYKGEVHKSVRDEVLKSDADQLCMSFNEHVVRQWTDYNFGPDVDAPKVWRRTEDDEDLNAVAERDERLHNIGWTPNEQRVADTYGEGYERRPMPVAPPVSALPGIPTEPATPEEFAEALAFVEGAREPLAYRKTAHRAAQTAIGVASNRLANRYDELLGSQVRAITDLLGESESLEDFAERLPALIADDPSPVTVDTIRRATSFGRVLGILQQKRNRPEASDDEQNA